MGRDMEIYENACRLCDAKTGNMHSIFEKNDDGHQILHLIKECLPVLVYRTDPLPKQVCQNCYINLNQFYDFKKITLHTLDKQKERLLATLTENDISVRLFLDSVSNEDNGIKPHHLNNSHSEGQANFDKNETELCTELHRAIRDSLHKSKLQENDSELGNDDESDPLYFEQPINGTVDLCGDDDSQTSMPNKDSPFSHNDMDLCDSEPEFAPKIQTTNITGKRLYARNHMDGPVLKKRRIIGPKSRVLQSRENYARILFNISRKREILIFNPLSLLQCALNLFNGIHVPDFCCINYRTTIKQVDADSSSPYKHFSDLHSYDSDSLDSFINRNICNYCAEEFTSVKELAEHEHQHIFVVLGTKVDLPGIWCDEEEAELRNKWFISNYETDYEFVQNGSLANAGEINLADGGFGNINVVNIKNMMSIEEEESPQEENEVFSYMNEESDDQSLLVPVQEEERPVAPLKGEVVLIDTKATVNGILLSELPKDERRTLYRSVTVNGIKRKFCPLCRYTFKDNWAIESHYFSTSCHYTCRFCGLRFNKQRSEFDGHIKEHILAGDLHTNKIFASKKWQMVPKVINESKMRARPPPPARYPLPKIKPLQMKQLMLKRPEFNTEAPATAPQVQENKPQNQAYFCRKCYQVFFKLDEFNVHVVSCTGTGVSPIYSRMSSSTGGTYNPRMLGNSTRKSESASSSVNSDNESLSPAGRPVRNCVREVNTYMDSPEAEDYDDFRMSRSSPMPTARGYECTMCSSCFPTVHSRNSHMRIHKTQMQLNSLSSKSISITRNRPNNLVKRITAQLSGEAQNIPTFSKYVNDVKIKQEPMEPLVEIHEDQDSSVNFPSSIGSVSITPIPNSSQRTTLDPSIMKLVQSNPNLTIKTMQNEQQGGGMPINQDLDNKCYRCSSCSKPFANKSNLYFHKKNQCNGSKYPCPFCRKRFGTEAAYSSHIFYNHPA